MKKIAIEKIPNQVFVEYYIEKNEIKKETYEITNMDFWKMPTKIVYIDESWLKNDINIIEESFEIDNIIFNYTIMLEKEKVLFENDDKILLEVKRIFIKFVNFQTAKKYMEMLLECKGDEVEYLHKKLPKEYMI